MSWKNIFPYFKRTEKIQNTPAQPGCFYFKPKQKRPARKHGACKKSPGLFVRPPPEVIFKIGNRVIAVRPAQGLFHRIGLIDRFAAGIFDQKPGRRVAHGFPFRKQDIAPPKEIFLYSAFPEIFSRNKSIIRFAATKELISFRNTCCSVIASFSSTAGL